MQSNGTKAKGRARLNRIDPATAVLGVHGGLGWLHAAVRKYGNPVDWEAEERVGGRNIFHEAAIRAICSQVQSIEETDLVQSDGIKAFLDEELRWGNLLQVSSWRARGVWKTDAGWEGESEVWAIWGADDQEVDHVHVKLLEAHTAGQGRIAQPSLVGLKDLNPAQ